MGAISENVEQAIQNTKNPEEIAHYDMRFVKPLDEDMLHTILKKNTIPLLLLKTTLLKVVLEVRF
jgi:1-deoxy-D-xylulose-5-phosphate synthase